MPPRARITGGAVSTARFAAAPSRQRSVVPLPATSKSYIETLMQRSEEELKALGFARKPTAQELRQYSPEQIYELLYGGSPSYFMNSIFDSDRVAEDAYIRGLTREINVQKSVYKCPNCAYDRIIVRQEQLRGGDESATAMKRCTRCGHRWSDSS